MHGPVNDKIENTLIHGGCMYVCDDGLTLIQVKGKGKAVT
jgi:hypothetical protein